MCLMDAQLCGDAQQHCTPVPLHPGARPTPSLLLERNHWQAHPCAVKHPHLSFLNHVSKWMVVDKSFIQCLPFPLDNLNKGGGKQRGHAAGAELGPLPGSPALVPG